MNDNVTPFNGPKVVPPADLPKPPAPEPETYEITLHGTEHVPDPVPLVATGYLKFGPAFIAVAGNVDDQNDIVIAVALGMVKFIKRVKSQVEV